MILYRFCIRSGNSREKQITSQWRVGWHTYLSSRRDFIIAHIDTGDIHKHREDEEERLGIKQAEKILTVLRYRIIL